MRMFASEAHYWNQIVYSLGLTLLQRDYLLLMSLWESRGWNKNDDFIRRIRSYIESRVKRRGRTRNARRDYSIWDLNGKSIDDLYKRVRLFNGTSFFL